MAEDKSSSEAFSTRDRDWKATYVAVVLYTAVVVVLLYFFSRYFGG